VLAYVGTRGETDAARGAKRGLTVAVLEADSLPGHPVYVPRFDRGMPKATKIVRSQLIWGND